MDFGVFEIWGKTQHCSREQVEPLFFTISMFFRTPPEILHKYAENIAETLFQLFFS